MKRYFFWLKTEYKRAAACLPLMLAKAAILIVIIGMAAFCAVKLLPGRIKSQPASIGYAAPQDRLTEFAVSFVENMESVKDWCRLIRVSEEEGLQMLGEGELAALLVLPDNVVEGILNGSNEPAKLYLSKEAAPMGLVFEELAKAGTGLLRTAQAEIYAAHELAGLFDIGEQALDTMYGEIDRFNLKLVMEREEYFRIKKLSATGSEGWAVYYGSAFLTLYLLFAGVFFGKYNRRSHTERDMLAKRAGIPVSAQAAGRIVVSGGLLLIALLPVGVYWIADGVRRILPVCFSVKSILLLILAVLCTAAWLQLVCRLTENHRTAVFVLGISALFMGYVSGCFLPSAILPRIVEKIAGVLPSTYIKRTFSMLFSGRTERFAGTAAALMAFCLFFWMAGLLAEKWPRREFVYDGRSGIWGRQRQKNAVKGSNLFCILAKRLLFQKSLWVCLAVTVFVSLAMMKAESRSDTTVYAAFYTDDEALENLFSEYGGLVTFVSCKNEEEVKRYVVQGKAECGYVLQEDLQSKILSGDAAWSIAVYESADSTLTRVVNEVLFERIFYAISTDWFEGYIAEHENFSAACRKMGREALQEEAKSALERKLEDGGTFTFMRGSVSASGTGEETKGRVSYPVRAVAAACVILCALIGVMQALADKKAHRFPKRTELLPVLFTVCQPVLMGMTAGILLSFFAGNMLFLLPLSLLVTLTGVILVFR